MIILADMLDGIQDTNYRQKERGDFLVFGMSNSGLGVWWGKWPGHGGKVGNEGELMKFYFCPN